MPKPYSVVAALQDSFIEELELIREDELANDLILEGQFLSEKEMMEVWGWSEKLVQIEPCIKSKNINA